MARRRVVNNELSDWMITFVKTVDTQHPVYYRLTNMQTYNTMEVAAHKLMDEVVNNKRNIVNMKCTNNQVVIINQDGYSGLDDIITVDEFDSEVPNIYEWALQHGELGCKILSMYSGVNLLAPSNIKIDSTEELAWECENKHKIHMDFATIVSLAGECPICKAKESGETLSFKVWANLTNNMELLEQYRSCELNTQGSSTISYDSKKKVFWKHEDKVVELPLSEVTIKGNTPFGKLNKPINLSR